MKRKSLEQLIEAEDRAEAKLRRAFRAWEKARTARVRAERRADRDILARANTIGGTADARMLCEGFNDEI
jgi:hypothetical protein